MGLESQFFLECFQRVPFDTCVELRGCMRQKHHSQVFSSWQAVMLKEGLSLFGMSSNVEVSGWQAGLKIRATLSRTQIKTNNNSKDGGFVHCCRTSGGLEDHDRNVLKTVGRQTRVKQVTLDGQFQEGPFQFGDLISRQSLIGGAYPFGCPVVPWNLPERNHYPNIFGFFFKKIASFLSSLAIIPPLRPLYKHRGYVNFF